jgi:hypothetical protein
MKASRKWLCIGALIVGGLLSLFLSFTGAMGFLWGGFPGHRFPVVAIAYFLPPLLAFPIFALAAAGSRKSRFAVWTLAPASWVATFEMTTQSFTESFSEYLKALILSLFSITVVALFVLAFLAYMGTMIYRPNPKPESAGSVRGKLT